MIWTNIIRIVILNNIQGILIVNRTPWVNANADNTVTFKPYNFYNAKYFRRNILL